MFLSRRIAAQCVFPLEAYTQWSLKRVVYGGSLGSCTSLEEFCPIRGRAAWSVKSFKAISSSCTFTIHILVGCCCCTIMEASVTEMSSVPGLDHGPWQHEPGHIICLGGSLTPSLAQVWVLWEAQLDGLTCAEWRNLDDCSMFS